MIRVPLTKEDNFELLLEVIGYERMTSMSMELDVFLADIKKGYFIQKHYRLAVSQDMMAHLEIEPETLNINLELNPRLKSVDTTLTDIVDAYFASKDSLGVASPHVFASNISAQAAQGVHKWLVKNSKAPTSI